MKNENGKGLLLCSLKCIELNTSCPNNNCRHWIDFEGDNNCCLVAVYNNGPMTLRQVSERIGVTFARIQQIEKKALHKLKRSRFVEKLFF
tara:strand:- start:459 stop:728 length:270 start_codon:yes stop_codon:yes gene_type:complete